MIPMTRSIHFVEMAAPLLLVSTLASAASPAKEQAKKHFQQAETAYRLGQYSAAIEGYEAAYQALPEPAFLFNLAQALRQQYLIDHKKGNLQRALTLYKTYLREARNAPNRELVQRLIEELKSILATLESETAAAQAPGQIVVNTEAAAGAEVLLDGRLIGRAPLAHQAPPGRYRLTVDREGFQRWGTTVELSPGARLEVPVRLEPLATQGPQTAAQTPAPTSATPLYKKWWFWTLVGAVAVAGAGTGIYLGLRDDTSDIPQIDLR